MKFTKNSIRYSLIFVLIISAVFTFLWKINEISSDLYFPILYAALITTVNFVLGIWSIKLGLIRSMKMFLILFIGGMIFRLFLMLIAVFICLKFLELKGNTFIFLVFIFYIFYQIIEIFCVIYRNK